MTGLELRVALEGYDALGLLEHSHHYQQYIREKILEHVPTGAAEVCSLTSCSFFFQHLVLIIILSSRRLAPLLLVKLWSCRLMMRGLRLREPVILSILRLFEESLQLVLPWVIFLFWIALCTFGLQRFRLLLSSISILMWRSLLSSHYLMLLM